VLFKWPKLFRQHASPKPDTGHLFFEVASRLGFIGQPVDVPRLLLFQVGLVGAQFLHAEQALDAPLGALCAG